MKNRKVIRAIKSKLPSYIPYFEGFKDLVYIITNIYKNNRYFIASNQVAYLSKEIEVFLVNILSRKVLDIE